MRIKLFEELNWQRSDDMSALADKLSSTIKEIKEISYLISDEDGLDVFIIGEDDKNAAIKTIVILSSSEHLQKRFGGATILPGMSNLFHKRRLGLKRYRLENWIKQQDFYIEFIDRLDEICKNNGVKFDMENPSRIMVYI